MSTPGLLVTLPAGTRYVGPGGVEYELLEPSTQRTDGTYPVPKRLYVVRGHVSSAPADGIAPCQSLEFRGAVTLPEPAQLDPYAEHRKRIGDDK